MPKHKSERNKLAPSPKDLLARVFLEELTRKEEAETRRLIIPDDDPDDAWFDILDDLKAPDENRVSLRPDKAAVAVLLARSLEGDRELVRALRRSAPVVVFTVPQADLVTLVSNVVVSCALPASCEVVRSADHHRSGRKCYVIAKDGLSKDSKAESGNDGVAAALNARMTIIGIAPNPRAHLPRDLMRAAEFNVTLPTLDASAISLVIEAVTGKRPSRLLAPDLVRLVDISDLLLAFRSDRAADECITRLENLIEKKGQFWSSGPSLEELSGYGAAKEWGISLAQDLRDLKSGLVAWEKIDGTSALLAGPPGTGKTSYARALAKTCCVPLVETSVAQWNTAGHLGATLQAMRDAFLRARRMSPCILFIDELDGISSRQNLTGDYVEYWLQIVNLLLELMTSPEGREGVVLLAATNYPEKIDPALRRSGRLDRQFDIAMPDLTDLTKILRFHLGNDLNDIDLAPLAGFAHGLTGADIEAIVRRARGAARRKRQSLQLFDILAELNPHQSILPGSARYRAAVHEAGHAVVCAKLNVLALKAAILTPGGGRVVSSTRSGVNDRQGIVDLLVMLAAGREAEIELLGNASLGAAMEPGSDLAVATELAMSLEFKSGLGELGPIFIDSAVHQAAMASTVLPMVRDQLKRAAGQAALLVREERRAIEAVALALKDAAYLSAEAIVAIIESNTPIAQVA